LSNTPFRSPHEARLRFAFLVALGGVAAIGAFGGCGSGTSTPNTSGDTTPSNVPTGSSSRSSSGVSSGSSSGSNFNGSTSSSGSGETASSSSGSGDDASGDGAPASSDDASEGEGGATSDGAPSATTDAPVAATPPPATPTPGCVKGQVPPNKVVIIGDSYLDSPAWSNVAPDLFMDARNAGSLAANVTYRQYQLGGAAMNYGALNLNIPYQYETTAKGDLAVMNPTDIDTIVMDGGGNDVIIDNTECLTSTTAPSGTDMCSTSIAGTLNRAQMVFQEMATDHVKHIVFFFYPHLDPAGGGLLPTPAPGVNLTLDYAYPLAEKICCGSSFTSTATQYTCSGQTSGTQCIFVDTRPAFEGHVADYIKSDHVHPTPAGAQVIADLLWNAMAANCIAQ
jgi:lysophospholipase L1-like esterase